MQQLSAQDAQFLYLESENNLSHVTTLTVYDAASRRSRKQVKLPDIVDHVRRRLDASPVFRRKLKQLPMQFDYPYWVDDPYFHLEAHLSQVSMSAPCDWQQLVKLVSQYHSRPLDMKRPLWEIQLITGLDAVEDLAPGSFALAIKIHHAAVDGASIGRFLSVLSDSDAKGTPAIDLEALPKSGVPRVPNQVQMGMRATVNKLKSSGNMTKTLLNSTAAIRGAIGEALSSGKEKSEVPVTRFDGEVSPHKTFDAFTVELDSVKQIRQAVAGATVNDAVLAICSGGLRDYLQHHNELPEQSLVAWVPINARPGGAADHSAEGNHISAMTAAICTEIENPLERLAQITAVTRRAKSGGSGAAARLLTELTKQLPSTTQVITTRALLRSGLASKVCNLFISNVPGPSEPLYVCGAKSTGWYGLAPLGEGMGLFIATPSHRGKLAFNVISTREIIPDMEFFMECLKKSYQEYLSLAKLA